MSTSISCFSTLSTSAAAARGPIRVSLAMTAMVALQAAVEAVLDQPCRAVGALQAEAAAAAQRQRRVAAPVQEQHRLLAGGERLGERRDDGRRQEALPLRPAAPCRAGRWMRR